MTRRRERGQALIVAILALLVLTLLGLALTSMSMVSMTIAINDREAGEAFAAADSGVAHAVALLESQAWLDFDPALQRGDGRGCTGDELAPPPSPAPLPAPELAPAAELIPAGGRAFAPAARYQVAVCDDDALERVTSRPPILPDANPDHDANGRVLVRSTGTGRGGASATVEAVLARVSLPALIADGDLRIDGTLAVFGSVHANGSLQLAGAPCAQQYFSASGGISGGGTAQGGGCTGTAADVRPAQDDIPVPLVAPKRLRSRAAYVLGADGSIRDQAGESVALSGWSWDGQRWTGAADIPPGAYYVEGNVEITGDPGRLTPVSPPLPLTLIAEGWVDFTGAPRIVPALAGYPAYTVVAGTDLRLSGNPGASYSGLFYAGDQADITGNATLVGQLIAKNAGDLGFPPVAEDPAKNNLVRLQDGGMTIAGNARIVFHGMGGLGALAVVGWRECRGLDPDNPCAP